MKEAMFYEKLADQKVHCYLCAHHCQISSEGFGICQVRQNKGGILYSLIYARVVAAHIDPIEKKPLYHFHPGSFAYSIATLGCNFKCGFCQNWQISQSSGKAISLHQPIEPQEVVNSAKTGNCLSIAYTYSEPTIFFEYAYDLARLAKAEGLCNVFVTNGYMTKEAITTISPYLDAANVDLKSFRQEFYQKNCKANISPVLSSIKLLKELGVWVEVTTLVIPGENDSAAELTDIAKFIHSVDRDIPWHVSGFHPDYKFADYKSTSLETLKEAKAIGEASGLRHVYLGNAVNV